MQLPLAYFEARRVGDTECRSWKISVSFSQAPDCDPRYFVVMYLALMFYYSVSLTWVALAVVPLFAVLILVSTPILRSWLNQTFNQSADSHLLVETITGIHAVKACGGETFA